MATRLTEAERSARRATIRAGLAAEKSQYAIAQELGLSRAAVQKELRAMRSADDVPTRAATNAPPHRDTETRSTAVVKDSTGGGSPFVMNTSLRTILPPPNHFARWRQIDLDRSTWDKADPTELVSLLVNISPEISRAVWDFLRLLNSGHEITAYRVGSNGEVRDARAQVALDEFVAKLEGWHGSFKVVAGRLFMAAITRGAFFAELVLDDTGRVPVDIATPDPAIVRFRAAEHPERGDVWEPGQWQAGQFVSFDVPTIRYLPLDPEPGVPYGRPMLSPAIFPTVFLLGLMHDLRRVVAQQGYPRTDIMLDLEALRNTYKGLDMKALEKKIDELIKQVERTYAGLEPDDAYVHTSTIAIQRAAGAVDASALRGCSELITAIERMATRALKTIPLMMNTSDSVAETRANREWEIFGEYIGHLQHYAETLLGRLFQLALQVQGIPADVEVRFAPVRNADALRDEQTMKLKLENAIAAENAGYMARDEASEYAVGHEAVEEEPEDDVEPPEEGDEDEIEAEPGEDRIADAIGQVLRGKEVRFSMTGGASRAPSDDVPPDLGGDVAFIDEQRLRDALDTWEEAFAGEDVETLLDAEVESDEPEDSDDGAEVES